MALSVSAQALHGRTLRIGEEVRHHASLFPCCERTGRTSHVIILHADSAEIYLLPWRRGEIIVPLWGAVRLIGESAWLKPIGEDQRDELQGLWHYDPCWVLKAPRYRRHWAVEPLEATNCVHEFTADVRGLRFQRDLSRIRWAQVRSHSEFNLQPWSPDLLPPPPTPSQPRSPSRSPTSRPTRGGWRFDPVWARWTAR